MIPVSRFSKSFLTLIVVLVFVSSLFILRRPTLPYQDLSIGKVLGEGEGEVAVNHDNSANSPYQNLDGAVIMSKLGNETAKAALGRATWKLLHTITLRYPEQPTTDERSALAAYFQLSARLYPCGECASEFQALLKEYPPQTSSRKTASLWLCHIHNLVNHRLQKPEFDCGQLNDTYDCGCGDDPHDPKKQPGADKETGIGNR